MQTEWIKMQMKLPRSAARNVATTHVTGRGVALACNETVYDMLRRNDLHYGDRLLRSVAASRGLLGDDREHAATRWSSASMNTKHN